VLATVSIPATGGWQNWQTVSANISLAAGTQTIRIYSASNGWNFNWLEIAGAGGTTTTTPPSTGTTTHVEAENYISMSGVAKENTTDAGGGQNVGYIDNGDWMDYSVSIASAGTFSISLRVASPSGGQLQIKNAAGSVLATVSVPNTGDWQNWQTISASITLPQGTQTIRVYSASNGWNFNWMDIIGGTTSTPPPSSTPTRVEAESYTNMNGVVKETTSDAGGGQNLGYIDNGDWMDYSITASAAGTYAVNLRVASPTGGQLQIKSSDGTVLATVAIPKTGGWQNCQTVSANISIAACTQTIRVYSASNGWNFNWWELVSNAGSITTKSISAVTEVISPLNISPNPVINNFQLRINNDLTGTVNVQVYNVSGVLQKQFVLSKPDEGSVQYYLSISQLAAGTYVIKVTMKDWSDSKQIIKQ
jgi:endoglucanase